MKKRKFKYETKSSDHFMPVKNFDVSRFISFNIVYNSLRFINKTLYCFWTKVIVSDLSFTKQSGEFAAEAVCRKDLKQSCLCKMSLQAWKSNVFEIWCFFENDWCYPVGIPWIYFTRSPYNDRSAKSGEDVHAYDNYHDHWLIF